MLHNMPLFPIPHSSDLTTTCPQRQTSNKGCFSLFGLEEPAWPAQVGMSCQKLGENDSTSVDPRWLKQHVDDRSDLVEAQCVVYLVSDS